MAIGIFDWGIGGIGLYKLLRKKCTADIVYFSDAGYTPYGKVHQAELIYRVEKVLRWFHEQNIDKIAVACNAASTVIPPERNITGIIEHGISMVMNSGIKEVAVAGGKRTIESGIYKNQFERSGIKTTETIGQPLSARIEKGDIDSPELKKDIEMIFDPVKNCTHLLLACTHYPVISDQIRQFMSDTTILNPDEQMCEWIIDNWGNLNGNSEVSWYTSGNAGQMVASAERAFGIITKDIQKIKI